MSGFPNAEATAERMIAELLAINKEVVDPKHVIRITHYMTPVFTQALHRAYHDGLLGLTTTGIERRLANLFTDFVRTLHEDEER
jgi:hypothetical protein